MNSQVLCFLGLQPVRPRVHCGIYISGDQRRDHATGGAPALEDDDELELLCEEEEEEDDDDAPATLRLLERALDR